MGKYKQPKFVSKAGKVLFIVLGALLIAAGACMFFASIALLLRACLMGTEELVAATITSCAGQTANDVHFDGSFIFVMFGGVAAIVIGGIIIAFACSLTTKDTFMKTHRNAIECPNCKQIFDARLGKCPKCGMEIQVPADDGQIEIPDSMTLNPYEEYKKSQAEYQQKQFNNAQAQSQQQVQPQIQEQPKMVGDSVLGNESANDKSVDNFFNKAENKEDKPE